MAQAESVTTAICELMSCGRPLKSTSPVRAAHTEFIAILAGNVLGHIHSNSNFEDLSADRLENAFAALHVYLSAIIAETAQTVLGRTPQFSAGALGVIRDAAAEMRGHENWRVS